MIWGRTNKERIGWRPWFAWFPVEFNDGRWAWLQTVERRDDFAFPTFREFRT